MPKARNLALALVATLLLALPASAAVKAPGKSVDRLASQACAKERQKIGKAAFRKKYGERGTTRACVRRGRSKVRTVLRDASSECLAELAEIGPLEFAEDYGTDETGSDALEQCMDETAELALDPGDDYSEEDEEE
jgi:hypothetical protein